MRFHQKYFAVLLAIVILVISEPRICLSSLCRAVKPDTHACCHKENTNLVSIKANCCKPDKALQEGIVSSVKTAENNERIPLEFTCFSPLNTQPKIQTASLFTYKNFGQSWGDVYSPILRI